MSDAINYSQLTKNGLWHNNPALVQVLGLCPLLAVSSSVANALGLGLATVAVLVCSNVTISLIRKTVSDAVRLPVFVMLIAAVTTCIELMIKAFTYELYTVLGIFIPLIVTNCIILGRADAFASKNRVFPSAMDGLAMGTGFMLVLVAVGAVRELFGSGTLFADMHLLFGEAARAWEIRPIESYPGFLIAILPPGAFIVTGFLIALKNVIDDGMKRREAARKPEAQPTPQTNRRVRTTGTIS